MYSMPIQHHQVEDRIYTPLMAPVLETLRLRVRRKELALARKLEVLRHKPQSYFEIPLSDVSISSWVRCFVSGFLCPAAFHSLWLSSFLYSLTP